VGGGGNNPLSYAIPAGIELPIVLDFAHSVVAHGKVKLAETEGKEIPLGWGVDGEGNPTTDPGQVVVLLPFGAHKGSGLAVVMEILSGILPGSRFCLEVREARERGDKWRIGHFFWALDIEGFMPIQQFKRRVDEYIQAAKALPKAPGVEEILMPGEIEYRLQEERQENGIPLARATVTSLEELGEELNVEMDLG
jgi:LDH2 family malate/lactate/ureidoglycolate dehydrogenase